MTTLYLQKEKGIQLQLDGPALVVKTEDNAKRLFPLQRLERVFVHASLEVSSRVLIGCARANVDFCFTDARLKPIMWCTGYTGNQNTLDGLLQQFMDRTDWELLLHKWQDNQLQQLVPAMADRLGLSKDQPNLLDINSHLTRRAVRYAGEPQAHASQQWLIIEAQGILLTLLTTQGITEKKALFWSTHLGTLLVWKMEGARIHWLGQRFTHAGNTDQPLADLTHHEFMSFFEQYRDNLYQAADQLLEQFSLWLQQP